MLKEYRSFSPFRPLLCWKTSHACDVSIQLGLLPPVFMGTWTAHYMDGCWTCGWSEIQCYNLDLLMVCTAPFVFVLCGPIYACVFLDLYLSSIFVHTNVSWSVLLHVNAYTLVMFVLLYWMGVRMCVAILFSVTLYFRDVPLWVLFLLPLPFPSSPSSLPIIPTPPAHWGCGTERNWTQEKGGEGYSQETAQDNWEGEEEKD